MGHWRPVNMAVFCAFSIGLCYLVGHVSANTCTDVLKRQRIEEVVVKTPCVEKYTARCGWLSLTYCTFTRQTFCDKKKNETITTYYIVTDCCVGFYRAKNGSCLKKIPGIDYSEIKASPSYDPTATEDPNYVAVPYQQKVEKSKKEEISGGGYAGIACGFVFLVCIVAFTLNAIIKRRRAYIKARKNHHAEQHVLYVSPSVGPSCRGDSPAPCVPRPDTVKVALQHKLGTPISGETTPHSRQCTPEATQEIKPLFSSSAGKRTPDMKDIEADSGVTPLLHQEPSAAAKSDLSQTEECLTALTCEGQIVDDIPESDV